MAFSEPERVKIRWYMGWPPKMTEPRYEALITYVQAEADGGQMPDGSTEAAIRATLGKIATIEEQIDACRATARAAKVSTLEVDPVRAAAMLRGEGRRQTRMMAVALRAYPPLIDVWKGSLT